MVDNTQLNTTNSDFPDNQVPNFYQLTATYMEIAEKVAQHTRISTQELTKIIASMRMANQV